MKIKSNNSLNSFLAVSTQNSPFFTYEEVTHIEMFKSCLSYMIMTETTLEDNHKELFIRSAVAFELLNGIGSVRGAINFHLDQVYGIDSIKAAVKFHLAQLQMLLDY